MAMSWKNPFSDAESFETSVQSAGTVQCYHLVGMSGALSANAVFALLQTMSALTSLPVIVSVADPVRAFSAYRPLLACFMTHPSTGEALHMSVTAEERQTSINSRHAVCPMMFGALVRAYWSVLAVAHYLGIQDSQFLSVCPCKWEIAIPSTRHQAGAQLPDWTKAEVGQGRAKVELSARAMTPKELMMVYRASYNQNKPCHVSGLSAHHKRCNCPNKPSPPTPPTPRCPTFCPQFRKLSISPLDQWDSQTRLLASPTPSEMEPPELDLIQCQD